MRVAAIVVLIVGILTARISTAQSGNDASPVLGGWPVVEQCQPEPISAPDGWSYPGTVLYDGPYGIHGINSSWPTSRVMAFTSGYWRENPRRSYWLLAGGSFSPDLMHYAAPQGIAYCNAIRCQGYTTNGIGAIRVFDLSGKAPNQNEAFDWGAFYTFEFRGDSSEGPLQIKWLDNERLVFMTGELYGLYWISEDLNPKILNTVTGEVSSWVDKNDPFCLHCSPDGSRDLQWTWDQGRRLNVLDTSTNTLLQTVDGLDVYRVWQDDHMWSPNSSQFVGVRPEVDQSTISLYDRDGNLIDVVLEYSRGDSAAVADSYLLEPFWSPNGRYLFLEINDWPGDGNTSFLIDTDQKLIRNLCLNTWYPHVIHWSPDSTGYAFMASSYAGPIMVYDLERDITVDMNVSTEGSVLGWRGD